MPQVRFRLRLKTWVYGGPASWRFVTLPKKAAQDVKEIAASRPRGWGSVPVTATLGATTWRTSVFPDSKSGSYVLPLKAQVRKAEGIEDGETVEVELVFEV